MPLRKKHRYDLRKIIELRAKLENEIRYLGGNIPPRNSWDNEITRNNALLEVVEELRLKAKGAHRK